MQRPSDLGFGDFPHSDLDLGILGDLKKKKKERVRSMKTCTLGLSVIVKI